MGSATTPVIHWSFKKAWSSQCAVWTQELDLKQNKLVGEKVFQTYGHANNATYAEGPHLYKVDGKYLIVMSEGGSSYHHAISAHHGKSVLDKFVADKVNPVLTHRHLGRNYPLHTIGHADLVQTQNGEWWAVALGVRDIEDRVGLTRETFLTQSDLRRRHTYF